MESLTSGEAALIRSVLAAEPGSERERIRKSKVPSRTFERARQRAYSEGWVFDRYVPDPARLGLPYVSFRLAQPYAERLGEVQAEWAADPALVHLWSWSEAVFGVFVRAGPSSGVAEPAGGESLRSEFHLVADVRRAQVPVYFDFEGGWARILGQSSTFAYPHAWPTRASGGGDRPPLSPSERRRLAELVRRAIQRAGEPGPLRVSPFFLPRSHQRILEDGSVDRRTFLDLRKVPSYEGRTIGRLGFIHGELVDGATSEDLFRRLAGIRVRPFLFTTDGSRVLLATLSGPPPVIGSQEPRPSVLANMQDFLRGIEIVRLPVSSMETPVNHRYDRLFPAQE